MKGIKIACIICFVFSRFVLIGQTNSFWGNQAGGGGEGLSPNDLKTLDVIPHSPEAEAMAKYGTIPISLYSGVPSISVPICEIKTPSFTVPFSLSYNNNGCRPNEIATSVGLGWSIQGGGVITRIIKGALDEDKYPGYRYDDFISFVTLHGDQSVLSSLAKGEIDGEPDLYVFNTGSFSGKFILVGGKAYTFPYQELKINGSPNSPNGFDITDANGTRYEFKAVEETQMTKIGSNIIKAHNSAWFLTKIISADKKDFIDYTYHTYKFKQPRTVLQTYAVDYYPSLTGSPPNPKLETLYYDGDGITSKMLSSVTSSSFGSIYFDCQNNTDDASQNIFTPLKLEQIQVTQSGGDAGYKQIELTHSYFGNPYSSDNKLKLDEVKIYFSSPTAGNTLKYSFEYESPSDIPGDNTKSINYWGYYNGAYNTSLFPKELLDPLIPGNSGNRNPNKSKSIIGTMKKITYPTGGYSTFEYEQNQRGHYNILSSYTNDRISLVADLKKVNNYLYFEITVAQTVTIRSGTLAEGANDCPTFPITKISQYVGTAFMPIFSSTLFNCPNKDFIDETIFLKAGFYRLDTKCLIGKVPNYTYIDYLKYDIDNTLADAPGLRIKKISSYDNLNTSTPSLVKQYSYNEGVCLSSAGIVSNSVYNNCARFEVVTYQSTTRSALSDVMRNPMYYKKVTEISSSSTAGGKTDYTFKDVNNLGEVKLASQIDYKFENDDFVPIRKVSNSYKNIILKTFSGTKAIKIAALGPLDPRTSRCLLLPGFANVTYGVNQNDVYTYKSDFSLLTQSKEAVYESDGLSFAETTTDYEYSNPDQMQPSKKVVTYEQGNNVQKTIVTEYTYPRDYCKCSTLYSINSSFINNLTAANNYMLTCTTNCVSGFKTLIADAKSKRNTALSDYETCLNSIKITATDDATKAIVWMQLNNIINPLIEQYVSIKKPDLNDYLLSATKNEYRIVNYSTLNTDAVKQTAVHQVELSEPLLKNTFLSNKNAYCVPKISLEYDSKLNMIKQAKTNDVAHSYIWGYKDNFPIAEAVNATLPDLAATSFEGKLNKGGWDFLNDGIVLNKYITGSSAFQLDNANNKVTYNNLDAAKTYYITYWSDGNEATIPNTSHKLMAQRGSWKLYSHEITGVTNVSITGTTIIDELRLYPKDAQMTTYTYEPLNGLTSVCDANNKIVYYEYDDFGRLKLVRDMDGNIIKKHDYKYQK